MTMPNGTGNGAGPHAGVAGSRPVILVRHRADLTGPTTRTVHLALLPDGGQPSALTSLCGIPLHSEHVEQTTPDAGMPCTRCVLSHLSALPPAGPPPDTAAPAPGPKVAPSSAVAIYRSWGWRVVLRREQVWLALEPEAVALMIPMALATSVTSILIERCCPPAILTYPYAPEHRILLAGEPYPVPLPWPPEVNRVTTTLFLPPTSTPRGRLTWAYPPHPNALALCREIDVLAALRIALDQPPPEATTAQIRGEDTLPEVG